MRRYRKWALTLGILAVAPGLAAAAPFSFGQPSNNTDANATGAPTQKSRNQQVAENIALALKKAAFHGYDIDIEYSEGLATLRGKILDPRLKSHASQIIARVPGVRRVENQLVVVSNSQSSIRQTSGIDGEASPGRDASSINQQKAMEIGRALQGAGLNGYDIEVMYQDGQGLLRGTVATQEQRMAAARAASAVPGIRAVSNQLRVEGQSAVPRGPASQSPYAMTAYQSVPGAPTGPEGQPMMGPPGAGGMGPGPVGPNGGPLGGPMVGQMGSPIGPGPTGVGPMGPMGAPMPATGPAGARGPIYDNPNIPEYAWPAYAQYPNYAAVTYPSQYSASAWPYIGPFYPYPQVPLNWRKVTLEWDDGYWDLKFDSKTDRWWWFMNPKNW